MRAPVLVFVSRAIAAGRGTMRGRLGSDDGIRRQPVTSRAARKAPMVRVNARDVSRTIATGHWALGLT